MNANALVLVCVILVGAVGWMGLDEDCQKIENVGNIDETRVIHEDYAVDGLEMHVEYMNLSNVVADEVI